MKPARKFEAVPINEHDRKMPQLDRAYWAAHRIMTENWRHPEIAGPGARRSAETDSLAKIVRECFGTGLE